MFNYFYYMYMWNLNQLYNMYGCNMVQMNQGIDLSNVKFVCSERVRNQCIEKAIKDELGIDSKGVRYYYNYVDLDSDGVDEIIVYLVGPTVCGTGGCTAMIFKRDNQSCVLLSKFTIVNNPIIVSNASTNGYRDLIMYVSGGGIEGYYAWLRFDGKTYPSNPSTQPMVPVGTKISGIGVIANQITSDGGIVL